jgi:uncharacterized protein YkwD
MAALIRGLATLVAAGLAALTTITTVGHVHPPAPVRVAHIASIGATGEQEIAGFMFSGTPPAPDPTPAPAEAPAVAPAAPAPAAPAPRAVAPAVTVGSAQQALINADRAAAGLPPLTWSGCLAGIAAAQSRAMVARGSIFHGSGVTQDFGCGLGSQQTGENVGYWSAGINDVQLNAMFMNSPEHRANIMGPYRYVGTAWAVAPNGYAYITVEFA